MQTKSTSSRWLSVWEILHCCIFQISIKILCWTERRLGSSEKVRYPSLFYLYWFFLFFRGRCFSCKPGLSSKLYCFFLRGLFHSTLLTMMKTSLLNLLNLWKSSMATSNSGGIRTSRDVGTLRHMIIFAFVCLLHELNKLPWVALMMLYRFRAIVATLWLSKNSGTVAVIVHYHAKSSCQNS